ncbi:MAG: hypothetical protein KKF79_11405 [Gammaproteobacteria bacterium]|nr:hypothetical protein [Gammaproteobacteria bacterium]MBU2277943.1 hypothetical protein [Gammaproteobacteria bacterium]
MPNPFQIVASPLFKLSLQRLKAFLTTAFGEELAATTLAFLQQQISQQLPTQPELAPISERLLALGIPDYRQWQLDKNNLLFYRVNNAEQRIELLLVMDSRQSLRKLLFELNLLF